MFIVIAFMLGGIGVGFLLRSKRVSFHLQPVITLFIWLLLFMLGVEIGNNPHILKNFGNLGFEALIISLSAILGSCIFAFILWKILTSTKKRNN